MSRFLLCHKPEESSPLIKPSASKCGGLGFVLALMSGFFYSLTSAVIKLAHGVGTTEIALLNISLQLMLNLPLLLYQRGQPFGRADSWLVLTRSAFFTAFLITSFMSTRYLPLTQSAVLVMSYTVWVYPMAKFFLKEKMGLSHFLALACTLTGVILVCIGTEGEWVSSDSDFLTGIGLAIFSAFLLGCSVVIMKKAESVTQAEVAVNVGLVGTLSCMVYVYLAAREPRLDLSLLKMTDCGNQWILLIGGFSFSLNQAALLQALKLEDANVVSLIRTGADLGFIIMWQVWLFGEIPSLYTNCGVALTMLGSFVLYLCRPCCQESQAL